MSFHRGLEQRHMEERMDLKSLSKDQLGIDRREMGLNLEWFYISGTQFSRRMTELNVSGREPNPIPWSEPGCQGQMIVCHHLLPHLRGTKQDNSSTKPQTLQWEDELGLAFTKDEMKYMNKSLCIPKTGYYFVYSQVTFRHDGNERDVSQTIVRVNANYPEEEVLLSGTKLLYIKGSYTTIYLGAMLCLKAGDQLMVNATDIKLVVVNVEYRTFFGAFMV
ncbi:tumor necrosis factor ligand superfamily member 15 [Rhinophrynus dorsalis]